MKSVQSLDRALEILVKVCSEKQGCKIVELEQISNLPKSTIHRLLSTLAMHGFIEKGDNSVYKAGPRVVELASVYLNNLELKTEAYPFLQALADSNQGAAHLAIFQEDEADGQSLQAVYIDKVNYITNMRLYSQIGRRIPLHCTAVGKILLSGLSDKRLRSILKEIAFTKFTDNTITDEKALLEEIHEARQTGIAYDRQEHEDSISCVGAPIYDYLGNIIAAISISGHFGDDIENARSTVKETAHKISKKFGYRF